MPRIGAKFLTPYHIPLIYVCNNQITGANMSKKIDTILEKAKNWYYGGNRTLDELFAYANGIQDAAGRPAYNVVMKFFFPN